MLGPCSSKHHGAATAIPAGTAPVTAPDAKGSQPGAGWEVAFLWVLLLQAVSQSCQMSCSSMKYCKGWTWEKPI